MDPVVLRALGVVVLVLALALAGRWWQRRDGRARSDAADPGLADHELEALGLDLDGAEAGAVLLSSPTCASCEQVRRVLGQLTAERAGLRWVDVDAADHLELATRHRVRRVPTLLVVTPWGRVLGRASGVPSVEELRRLLDAGARSAA